MYNKILYPVLAFIIGFGCVWAASVFDGGNSEESAMATESASTLQADAVSAAQSQAASLYAKKIAAFEYQLQQDNLLFLQVDSMHSWQEDSINASYCDSIFIQQVCGYYDIIQMLRRGDIQDVVKYQNEHQVLSDTHLWQIRAAYKGWRDDMGEHEYDQESIKEAKLQFEKDYQSYLSFRDIESIREGKTEILQ